MGKYAVLDGGRSLWEGSEIWNQEGQFLPKLCFQLAPATIPKTTKPRACCEETLLCQLAWEPGQAQLATHSASSLLPPALQAARGCQGSRGPTEPDGIRALPFFVCRCFLPFTESACCCFIRPWGKLGPARLPAQSPWEAASREGADIQAQSPASGDWWLGHPLPAPDPDSSSLSAWPRNSAPPWRVLGPHSLSVTGSPWRQALGRALSPS